MSENYPPDEARTKIALEVFKAYVEFLQKLKKAGGPVGEEAEKQLKYFEPLAQLTDAFEVGSGLAEAAQQLSVDLEKDRAADAARLVASGRDPGEAEAIALHANTGISRLISVGEGSVFGRWVAAGDAPLFAQMIYLWKTHNFKMKPDDAIQYLIDHCNSE